MKVVITDGGRSAAGYRGIAGDCVCRAVSIVSGKQYADVYKSLASGSATERRSRGKSARNGIRTSRKWFKEYMQQLGFKWVATMGIGTGCKVHLADGELPTGKLVVSVSKHYTAVIDGVIHDTHDPQRIGTRCVYGYWILQ